jgi:hypothetical protein
MSDLEGVGEAATGAMLARAVEPRAGEGAGQSGAAESGDGRTHEGNCLNCGALLAGDYCHACGQKAHVHRTLGAFWHDLAHSVTHFDGKLWRTLPMLAWRPGELTRRFIDGERARFVSPMALFLFTVFLMFAIFSVVGLGPDTAEFRNTSSDISSALEEEKRDLAEHQKDRREALAKRDAVKLREAEDSIRETQAGIEALNGYLGAAKGDTSQAVGGRTGWKRIDDGIKKLNSNPALAFYKIQANAYKFSWALIPISVPFVWLLFLHRRRYRQFGAYDHTVFVTYSIAFMSVGLIVVVLLMQIPGTEWLRAATIVIPPIHMYRQLRGAYSLSRWSAVWRTAALLSLTLVTITLFLFLLLALGILA